jgi:hypothetical protein
MEIEFGFYEFLRERMPEWHSFNTALKILFINLDIEQYADYTNRTSRKSDVVAVNTIEKEILPLKSLLGKKEAYTSLVKSYCGSFKIRRKDNNSNQTTEVVGTTRKIEYENILKLSKEEEQNEEEKKCKEEQIENLLKLLDKIGVSLLEKAAFDAILNKRITKELNNFTRHGVIQFANRAALRLYLYQANTSPH